MPARKQPAKPTSNAEAAQTSSRRKALEVLRDTLAVTLDVCDVNMKAQVAGQYRAVLKELDELPVPQEESTLDDLARRRAARRADATHPGGAAVGDERRPGGRRAR